MREALIIPQSWENAPRSGSEPHILLLEDVAFISYYKLVLKEFLFLKVFLYMKKTKAMSAN